MKIKTITYVPYSICTTNTPIPRCHSWKKSTNANMCPLVNATNVRFI